MDTELSGGHAESAVSDPATDPEFGDRRPGSPTDIGTTGSPESAIDRVDLLLDEVERALTRLDDGTYGRCGSCGSPIEDAVLAGDPAAQNCGRCGVGAGPTQDRALTADAAPVADEDADAGGGGRTPSPGPAF